MADRFLAGFNIYDDHTNNWGMLMLDCKAPTPKQIEVIESVPYRNGSYDFSLLGGGPTYEDREITFVMEAVVPGWQERADFKVELSQWLRGRPPAELTTESYENYIFNDAKCTDIDFENIGYGWRITITFRANPEMTNIMTGERVVG